MHLMSYVCVIVLKVQSWYFKYDKCKIRHTIWLLYLHTRQARGQIYVLLFSFLNSVFRHDLLLGSGLTEFCWSCWSVNILKSRKEELKLRYCIIEHQLPYSVDVLVMNGAIFNTNIVQWTHDILFGLESNQFSCLSLVLLQKNNG